MDIDPYVWLEAVYQLSEQECLWLTEGMLASVLLVRRIVLLSFTPIHTPVAIWIDTVAVLPLT